MSLIFFLLVTSAFVSGYDTVLASTDSQQFNLSSTATVDAVQSHETTPLKRSGNLRISGTEYDRGDDDTSFSEDLESAGEKRETVAATSWSGQPARRLRIRVEDLDFVDDIAQRVIPKAQALDAIPEQQLVKAVGALQTQLAFTQKFRNMMKMRKEMAQKIDELDFDGLEKHLLGKVNEDKYAEGMVGEFMREEWDAQWLKHNFNIEAGIPADPRALKAYSTLVEFRFYHETLLLSKDPVFRARGAKILKDIYKNPIAERLFGDVMDGSLKPRDFRYRLGILESTPKNSVQFQAAGILNRLDSFNRGLVREKVLPANQIKLDLFKKVFESPRARKVYLKNPDKDWSIKGLTSALKITPQTAPDAAEYQALSALLRLQMLHGVAKTPRDSQATMELLKKLPQYPRTEQYFGAYVSGALKEP